MGVRVSTDDGKGKGKRPSDTNPGRARVRGLVPSKGDLVDMALDCYDLALNGRETTWPLKDGTERTTRKTDLRAALDAVRTLQTLLGYDKRDDGPKTPEQMAEFRRELVRFATTDPETVALLEEARKAKP